MRRYFFENPPEIFYFFTLPLEIPGKTMLKTSGYSTKLCYIRSLGNSKAKKKDPWEFHIIFSWSSDHHFGNSTSFLINPWKFHMLFLWYPWKFHMLFIWYPWKFHTLNPPVPFGFFLEWSMHTFFLFYFCL